MNALIGIGALAGLAAALLFAAIAAGNPIGILLFYFASLPLLIAGIGWGWLTAIIGTVVGAIAVALGTGVATSGAFLATVGIPAAWISYLALLARTDEDGTEEWYPVGRLLIWTAGIGAALGLVTWILVNQRIDDIRAGFGEILGAIQSTPGQAPPSDAQIAEMANGLIALLPPVSAALWMCVTLLNLYIAARIVRGSARMRRPWPGLSEIDLPAGTGFVFATAIVASFFVGPNSLFGVAAVSVAAVLLIAFAALGLAVVHFTTRGSSMRTMVLIFTYLGLIFFGWPIILFAGLGLLERRFRFRDRRRPPSPPGTT
ncbi:MAG: DUF2232 domain-containing protein [Pseudomonadota bacterium]